MDPIFANAATVLAVITLGLSAGALLAEGGVLVPFWRALPPQEFLAWYERNAALLLRFFGPLEIVPVVALLLATGLSFFTEGSPTGRLVLSTLLALGVLLFFPLYFRRANESFATASVGVENVGAELGRWAAWHWARTIVAIAAFAAALSAL